MCFLYIVTVAQFDFNIYVLRANRRLHHHRVFVVFGFYFSKCTIPKLVGSQPQIGPITIIIDAIISNYSQLIKKN